MVALKCTTRYYTYTPRPRAMSSGRVANDNNGSVSLSTLSIVTHSCTILPCLLWKGKCVEILRQKKKHRKGLIVALGFTY